MAAADSCDAALLLLVSGGRRAAAASTVSHRNRSLFSTRLPQIEDDDESTTEWFEGWPSNLPDRFGPTMACLSKRVDFRVWAVGRGACWAQHSCLLFFFPKKKLPIVFFTVCARVEADVVILATAHCMTSSLGGVLHHFMIDSIYSR